MPKTKLCAACGNLLYGRRDARTCSTRCRKALQRYRQQAVSELYYKAPNGYIPADSLPSNVKQRATAFKAQPPKPNRRFGRTMSAIALGLFGLLSLFLAGATPANAATSSNLNFQARLLDSSGDVVPDGNYHIEFKIYDSISSGGSAQGVCSLNSSTDDCWWKETRTTGNLVRVVNGYFNVNLGSVTAFGSTIPWDQQLYLTMRIGGSAGSASWEASEMTNSGNRIALTGVPYAFTAGRLQAASGTNTGILELASFGQDATITIPDPGASSDTVCLENLANCGGGTVTLQDAYDGGSAGDQVVQLTTANDSIVFRNPSSSGSDSAYVLTLDQLSTSATGGLDIQSAGTGNLLRVRDTTATAADVLTIADGGAATFRVQTESDMAFNLQSAGGYSYFRTDSNTGFVGIGQGGFGGIPSQLTVSGANFGDGSSVDLTIGSYEGTAGFRDISFTEVTGSTHSEKWATGIYTDNFATAALQNAYFIHQTRNKSETLVDTNRFLIDDNGNVGIGTGNAAPGALLHVSGASGGGSSTDLFKVTDTTSTARDVLAIADGGATTFRNQTDSTTAFQIQNAAGSTQLNFSTIGSILTLAPTGPTYIGGADSTGTANSGTGSIAYGNGVAVNGRYAYFIKSGDGATCSQTAGSAAGCELQVYDNSNPGSPKYLGGADRSGTTNGGGSSDGFEYIVAHGRYVYIAAGAGAGTRCDTQGNAFGCEIQIYDVSNPSTPTIVGGMDSSGSNDPGVSSDDVHSLDVSGNYLVVAKKGDASTCTQAVSGAEGCELQIYDISNPAQPRYVGGADISGTTNGGISFDTPEFVKVSGKYAYLTKNANVTACSGTAGGAEGCELQVYDISNPATPRYVGGADSEGAANSGTGGATLNRLGVSGRYLAVGKTGDATACQSSAGNAGGCETQLYDISNPGVPTLLSGIDASGSSGSGTGNAGVNSVALNGRYLTVGHDGSATACSATAGSAIGCELQTYDISNPASPTYTGGADISGSTNSGTVDSDVGRLAVAGSYVYVSALNNGTACSQTVGSAVGCELQIYHISGLETPSITAGSTETGSLQVLGDSSFGNDVTITGSLGVGQNVQIAGSLGVKGNVVLADNGGELNPWQTSPNGLSANKASGASVTLNGYIYYVSGDSGGFISTAVEYAKLNADGSTGSFTATTSLPDARRELSAVTANGYVYAIGGVNSGGTVQSTVYYAKANTDGSLGAWSQANNLPSGRRSHGSFVANGYIYVVGGDDNTDDAGVSTVYYAKVNADGSLGTWQTNAYDIGCATPGCGTPDPRLTHFTATTGRYVYVMFGYDAGSLNNAYYAPLNADGSTGAWTATVGSSAYGRDCGQCQGVALVNNGYVYVIGGNGSGVVDNAIYAKINSDGSLDGWRLSSQLLPAGRDYAAYATANGYMYVLGGPNTSNTDTVFYTSTSRVMIGGSLDLVGLSGGSLTDGGETSQGSLGGSLTAGNTKIIGSLEVQGQANFAQSLAVSGNLSIAGRSITLGSTNSGELSAWNTTTALSTAIDDHASVAANGYVYLIGGTTGTPITTVSYAKQNADGTLGSWDTTTALPEAREDIPAVAANGYVYVIGGGGPSGVDKDTVYYAKLNSDGTVGAWSTTTTLPAVLVDPGAIAVNGYLYVLGGNSSGIYQSAVHYAKLNTDGTLGAWSTGNSMPNTLGDFNAVTANGFIYVIGGINGSTREDDVHYAPINPDGSIGTWNTQSNVLPAARTSQTSIVANGYVYVIGGELGTAPSNEIYYAKLNIDGSTGTWATNTTTLPEAREDHSTVIANGYIYVLGGFNSTQKTTAYYASTSRIQLGGSLDLVGLSGGDMSQGGTGGSLTAGNTKIVGSLEVQGQANFSQSLAVNGNLNIGTVLGVDSENSQVSVNSSIKNHFSDEFDTGSSPDSRWAFTAGDSSTATISGGNLVITPNPATNAADCWESDTSCYRLLEDAPSDTTNLRIDTEIMNNPPSAGLEAGILIWQDSTNFIKIVKNGTSNALRVHVVDNNVGDADVITCNAPGAPVYMRVLKEGDLWTLYYSGTGGNFFTCGSFTSDITVNQIGLHANKNTTSWTTNLPTFNFFRVSSPALAVVGATQLQADSTNFSILEGYDSADNLILSLLEADSDWQLRLTGNLNIQSQQPAGGSVINVSDKSSGINLFNVQDMGDNFGGLATSGAFVSNTSFLGQEFNKDTNPVSTTANINNIGDDGAWAFHGNAAASSMYLTPRGVVNGVGRIANGTISGVGGLLSVGGTAGTLNAVALKANLPVLQMKIKPGVNNATNDIVAGLGDQAPAPTANNALPNNGIFFSNNNAAGGWQGVVRSGGSNVDTVNCSGSISTTQFAILRIQVEASDSVRFLVDNDASDGISFIDCGVVGVNSNPTAALTPEIYVVHTETTARSFDIDYIRMWQDDSAASESSEESSQTPSAESPITEPPLVVDGGTSIADQMGIIDLTTATSEDTIINHDVYINGTLFADKIKANEIEGLSVFTDQLTSLQQKLAAGSTSSESDSGDMPDIQAVPTSLSLSDGLTIGGEAQFHGNAFFYKLVTFVEKTVFNNDVTFGSHLITDGGTPSAKSEIAAGITTAPADDPLAKLANVQIDGNDISGNVELTIGKDADTGKLFSVDFTKTYGKAPRVFLSAVNAQAANLHYFVKSTDNGFTITTTDAALPPGTVLKFNFWVVE